MNKRESHTTHLATGESEIPLVLEVKKDSWGYQLRVVSLVSGKRTTDIHSIFWGLVGQFH